VGQVSDPPLKTGIDATSHIIRGEDPQSLVALTADYHREYQPDTPQMSALIDAVVAGEWLLRPLNKTEAQLWEHYYQSEEENDYFNQKNPLGEIFSSAATIFSRLQRRIDSTGRAWQRAYKELERIRAHSANPVPEPAPQPIAPEPNVAVFATPYPEIGFVPHPPEEQSPGYPAHAAHPAQPPILPHRAA
jgi:hypothetical protein